MKKIYLLGGVLGLVAAGISGNWYYNQTTAQAHIETALEQFNRGQMKISHSALDIKGFPFAYEGVLTDTTVRFLNEGFALQFPQIQAGMSTASIGSIDLAMPEEFAVIRLSEDGALTDDKFTITSEDFVGTITPVDDDDLNMQFSADKLRAALAEDTAQFVEFKQAETLLKLSLNPAEKTAEFDISFDIKNIEGHYPNRDQKAPEDTLNALMISDLSASSKSSMDNIELSLKLSDFMHKDGMGATQLINALDLQAQLKPEAAFDLSPLFLDEPNAMDAESILSVAAKSLAERGLLDIDASLSKLDMQINVADSEVTFALTDALFTTDISPKQVALALNSDQARFNIVSDTDKGSTTTEKAFIALNAVPGENFDFSTVINLSNMPDRVFALLDIIRFEVAKGGSVTLHTGSDHEINTFKDYSILKLVGIDHIKTASGPNNYLFNLSPENIAFSMKGDAVQYIMEGTANGEATSATIEFSGRYPLKQSDDTQAARIFMNIADLDINESLWNLLQLGGTPKPLPGLRLDVEVDTILSDNLLSVPSLFMAWVSAQHERITIKEALLEGLDMHAEGTGVVQLTPRPSGSVLFTLQNWQQAFDRLQDSLLAQVPDIYFALMGLQAIIKGYGDEGDQPDTTVMNIEVGDMGIMINGKPF